MTKFFTAVSTILVTIGIIVWTLVVILGGAELLWWIFTGDFFHFVVESTSTGVW